MDAMTSCVLTSTTSVDTALCFVRMIRTRGVSVMTDLRAPLRNPLNQQFQKRNTCYIFIGGSEILGSEPHSTSLWTLLLNSQTKPGPVHRPGVRDQYSIQVAEYAEGVSILPALSLSVQSVESTGKLVFGTFPIPLGRLRGTLLQHMGSVLFGFN